MTIKCNFQKTELNKHKTVNKSHLRKELYAK